MKKIFIPFLLFFIICGFIFASFPIFANDIGGSDPITTEIPWDTFQIYAPVSTAGSSSGSYYEKFVFGNPFTIYDSGGASSSSDAVQFDNVFRKTEWQNSVVFAFNNQRLVNNPFHTVRSSISFNTGYPSLGQLRVLFSADKFYISGAQFLDYLSQLSFSCIPIGSGSFINRVDYSLQFSVVQHNVDVAKLSNNGISYFVNQQVLERTYVLEGSSGTNSASFISGLTDYDYDSLTSLIDDFDIVTTHYYVDSAADHNETVSSGYNDTLCFSDVTLTITFVGYDYNSIVLSFDQALASQGQNLFDSDSVTYGSNTISRLILNSSELSFESVVNATGAFFDIHFGPGITLGMLAFFGMGLLLVVLLLKIFKGG